MLIAGSDQNNDGFICDTGESCGSYPTIDAFEIITVSGNRTGLDFLSGFRFGVNAAATSSAPTTAQGFRRLR